MTGEAANHKRDGRNSRKNRRLLLLLVPVLLLAALAGTAVGLVADALRTLPVVAGKAPAAQLSSRIYDKDGHEVTKIYDTENRIAIDIDKVPKHVQDAFIAVEDRNFWRHFGLDIKGIARAVYNDLRNRPLQGASTITQQLARNAFPIGNERSLRRKLQEAILALELERRYTKKEILEMYLNRILFGRDAYGIEAAARTYFNKPAEKLTLAEGALLAGLPQAPNDYEPIGHPERAVKRRNLVLSLMAENGFITAEEAEKARQEPLKLNPGEQKWRSAQYPAPHFVDYVLAHLLKKYPPELVYQGGLKIYTTLDRRIQEAAEKAVQKHLDKEFPLEKDKDAPQAALVVIDPWTGYLRAIVGGRDHKRVLELNRAWYNPDANCCVRQPGSAFKPLAVYAPALATKKHTAASVWDDSLKSYKNWQPKNYDRKYRGLTTMREAVRRSANTVAVRVLENIGPAAGVAFAQKLGITTLVTDGSANDLNLATALGGLTRGVSVMEMAQAYAAFANGGQRVEPLAILRVVDASGNVLEENKPHLERAMSPEVAYIMADMLRSVVEPQPNGGWIENWGTGKEALVPNWPTAGKTGTTSDNKDVWFVGFTPKYAAAVWIGRDNPKKAASLPASISGGGKHPARIFRDTMVAAHKGLQPEGFLKPRGIVTRTVSVKSGKLAGPDTPPEWARREIFIAGTEPKTLDDAFVQAVVCAEQPDVLFDAACGCTAVTRTFLKRDVATDDSGRFLAADMAMAPPAESCRGKAAAPGAPPASGGTEDDGGKNTGETNGAAGPARHDGRTLQILTVSRGGFSPAKLTVPKGNTRLRLAGADDEHEVVIPELGLKALVPAGQEVEAAFTAREGIYLIRCSRHEDEVGRLIVTP